MDARSSPDIVDTCQCPKCGRMHRQMGFGGPPKSIMEQIANDIREGTFPKKSAAAGGETPCPGCDGYECDDGCRYPGVVIEADQRCPTCSMTDAGYSVYVKGWCRDPWHTDDHLRRKDAFPASQPAAPIGGEGRTTCVDPVTGRYMFIEKEPARSSAGIEEPTERVKTEMLALADEFEGEAKAHRAMGDRGEYTKCLRAAYALRTCADVAQGSKHSGTFLGYRNREGAEMHCANAFCPHQEKCRKGCVSPVALPSPSTTYSPPGSGDESGCARKCVEADDSGGSGIDRNSEDTTQGDRPAAVVKVPSPDTPPLTSTTRGGAAK